MGPSGPTVSEWSSLATGIPASVVVGLGLVVVTFVSPPGLNGRHQRSAARVPPSSPSAAIPPTRHPEFDDGGEQQHAPWGWRRCHDRLRAMTLGGSGADA